MAPARRVDPLCVTHMLEKGMSARKIATVLGVHHSSVNKALSLAKNGPSGAPIGRRSKLTNPVRTKIKSIMKDEKKRTLNHMKCKLADGLGIEVSVSTVRRWVKKEGYHATTSVVKKAMTHSQKDARLKWAKEYRTNRQRNMIFTDESIFDSTGYAQSTWIQRGEDRPVQNRPNPPKSVQIWAGISWAGKTKLHVFDHGVKTNADIYCRLLDNVIRDDLLFSQHRDAVLYQDNSPVHTAAVVKNHLSEMGLPVAQAPPNSPDLNPIEHIWAIMEQRMPAERPGSYDELVREVEVAYQSISLSEIRHCISHLTKVKEKLIKQKGGHLVGE